MSSLPPPPYSPAPAPPPPAASRFWGVRRIAVLIAVGALGGFVLFCVFGPGLVTWYWTTPAKDAFSCEPSVSEAVRGFVKLQMWSAVAGAVALLVLVVILRALWRKITGGGAGAAGKTPAGNVMGEPSGAPPLAANTTGPGNPGAGPASGGPPPSNPT